MNMNTDTSGPTKPHMSFGIVADVQYADCDNGTDYSKTRVRYYRNALNLLRNAVNDWIGLVNPVAFVLQLGDLIDGKSNHGGEGTSLKALTSTLHIFNSIKPVPTYHIIGNHDLYNLPRSFYLQSSEMNPSLSLSIETSAYKHLYYTFLPHPKLRIVNIDTYEVSLLGYQDRQDDPNFVKAQDWFRQHNSNKDVNDVTGLEGLDKRWAAYNGGVSQTQLQWLEGVLHKATSKEENVIITSHIGLKNEIKNYTTCLAWNSEQILSVIAQFPCVVAVLSGHEHSGYDFLDPDTGVQHITMPAIIETTPEDNAYATARMWDDKITISGVGRIPSYSIALKYPVVS